MSNSGIVSGLIMRNAKNTDAVDTFITPLTLTFRGLDSGLTPYLLSSTKPTGEKRPIRGVACDVYTLPTSTTSALQLMIDAKRDYNIIRMERLQNGVVVSQLDIDYREDTDTPCKWVPKSWKRTDSSLKGVPWRVASTIVKTIRINEPQNADQFDLVYPPDTLVYDQNNKKDYRVLPNGQMRELDHVTGKELTATRDQTEVPWYQLTSVRLLGGALFVVMVTTLYVRHRQKRVAEDVTVRSPS
jgi:hypothetical protein